MVSNGEDAARGVRWEDLQRAINRRAAWKAAAAGPGSAEPRRTSLSYVAREVPGVAREEWDGWLRGSPGGGHVLQSYAWGDFKQRQGWRPLRVVLERGGEVVGLGQFLVYGTAPVPGALAYCPKGPWLPWEDEEAVRAFFEGVRVAAGRRAHTVKIEPEVPEQREDVRDLLAGIGFRKARYDLNLKTTLVVDLEAPEEEVLARMKGKTRYNVRLAARKGVTVVEPLFEKGFETFYSWMRSTSERKEGYQLRRSCDYLLGVMRFMRDAGQGRLFFAEHEGTPLAGMYVFTFGEKYWYMYGASGEEQRNLKPNYLLQWEVMRWAKERGLTRYDMVGVPQPEELDESSSLWGVYKFKEGFGGEISDSLGCFDLPLKPARAAAWYELEPLYYRLYYKLKNNVFY